MEANQSVIVTGEKGMGKSSLALSLHGYYQPTRPTAIATYKGSGKKFFQGIAMQLDIPTEDTETGKPLTMDGLKEEIAINLSPDTVLILPEAKRLTTGIRYWLEDLLGNGVLLVCFSVINPQRDIFLDMIEVELELPDDQEIRKVMEAEAEAQGLNLTKQDLAELQPLAGRNPMLARKVIRNRKLGINQGKTEHTQYVVIMPVIIAALMAFGIVRFIGMGTGNKSLYITGGVALVSGMALKQLGSVRGARKRLGQ